MIKIQNLSFSFLNHKVLNNISIDFPKNHVYGIVGLNGAGKTTFFNVLSTYLKTKTGVITFNGSKITYKDIAYLETVNYFYSRITGNEYLKIFAQTNPDFNLNSLQEYFKLPLDDLIETYSTGMKKKLALLGVLKQNKQIFLLDEPFNGLDLETNKIVELIIETLRERGKTVFVSSHIIDPLLTVCHQIHHLENGEFIKTYEKDNFHSIEDELFKTLRSEAKTIISRSI